MRALANVSFKVMLHQLIQTQLG